MSAGVLLGCCHDNYDGHAAMTGSAHGYVTCQEAEPVSFAKEHALSRFLKPPRAAAHRVCNASVVSASKVFVSHTHLDHVGCLIQVCACIVFEGGEVR